MAGSKYDGPNIPLINDIGWKTIKDFIKHESQIVVLKSINSNNLCVEEVALCKFCKLRPSFRQKCFHFLLHITFFEIIQFRVGHHH